MAEIPGATVDFTDYAAPGTPRVLNIPDSHGDVTIQDVWDTLSALSAQLDNLIYKKLLERPGFGGKGSLSPTKKIGISMKLNNCKIKFEDLAGPGYTIKRVADGNLLAQDHLGDDMEPMENSTFVNWKTEADTSAAFIEAEVLSQQVADDIVTITSTLATMNGTLSSVDGSLVTIASDIGTIQVDIGALQLSTDLLRKLLQNKTTTDPSTGVMTIYDDDDATPLFTANIFEDVPGTQPYQGSGVERRDRLA
jgi:hypothetical protein